MNSKTVILSNQICKITKYYNIPPISKNKYLLNYINGPVQKLTINADSKLYLDPHNLFDIKNQRNTFIKFILLLNNSSSQPVLVDFLLDSFRIFCNNIPKTGLSIDPNITYLFHIYSFDNGYTWRILLGSKFGPGLNWGELDPSQIQNGIKKPSVIGDLSPVEPQRVLFPQTSPFENFDNALILDNHAASEYRITSDISGKNAVYSFKDSEHLLGNITLNLDTPLEQEIEYFISVRYYGNLYISEWSDPIGIIIIFCTPDTPSIISYTTYDYHVMSDGDDNINFITTEYMTNADNDNHRMTDFKICLDKEGNIPIYEINGITEDSQLTNYSISDLSKLVPNTKYYLFARYYGTICNISEWSNPVMIEYLEGLLTKSGRKLYRHESNKGTVMEYYEYDGSFHKVVILDAQYRIQNKILNNVPYLIPNLTGRTSNNSKNNTYIDGSKSYSPPTTILNNFTDTQLNNIWTNQDDQTCKANCDEWLRISADVGKTAGLYKVREQTILGGRCEIPTFNILMRMYIEADNIDSLDPTVSSNPTKALGKSSNYFTTTHAYSSTRYLTTTKLLSIYYSGQLYDFSITNNYLIYPVFELYDKQITQPIIYNYDSNGDFNTTYLKTAHSEDHIQTNWQVFSDSTCSTMVTTGISNSTDPEYISFIDKFDFEDNTEYYIKCQHVGSYSGESEWSQPYLFKYLINKNTVYRLPSKRKIYRHESNKGSVLEYIDYNGNLVKLLILDSSYRALKRFASANFNNSKLTGVSNINKYNSNCISTANTTVNYNTTVLPIYTDKQYNEMYTSRHHTSFNGNAKQSCDTWMTYSQSNSSTTYAVPYCRSIDVNKIKCDLPTIDQLRLIFLEAEHIDALDESTAINRTLALGRRNSNSFWNGDYAWSCTKYSTTDSYNYNLALKNNGLNDSYSIYSNGTLLTIPILELPDYVKITKPIIISPLADENIYTGSTFIQIKSNSYESTFDEHLATNWKICSDSDGQSIIAESYNDTIHLTEINLLCNLQKNITYYIFVQYIGTFGTISEWSDPIRIFNAEYKLTNSNRKIYRHQSGYGSVLEFNDRGIIRKVLILDAKYRKLENMSFGLFGINVDLDNYSIYPTSNGTFTGNEYNPYENIPVADDDTINSQWGEYLDNNTSKYNCDVWESNKSIENTNHTIGCPIVQYCRETLYTNINVACDLPNINTLLRIYFEADNIDSLDPTINDFKQNKLGLSDDNNTFWGNTLAISSTNYDEFSIRTISYNGYITKYNKNDNFVNINNTNSPFFIIPTIEITDINDKVGTPSIINPINGENIDV